MAGGPGQPEPPSEHDSETSKYLSLLKDAHNIFQGYSKSSDNKYIPRSVLAQYFILGGGSLDQLLRETLEHDEHIPPVETILQQYLAVFSILLSIGKGKYLNRCVERDYSDERLPFFDRPRHFPKSDDGSFFDTFFDAQWRFCPAKITKNPINFQIEPEQILPLKRRERISSNAFSTAYLVEVHEEYDSFAEDNSISVKELGIIKPARHTYLFKEFNKASKPTYDKELAEFLHFQKSGQLLGNLLTGFYGSFIHDETFTIVLEHADRGHLDDFMKRVPPPTSGDDIIRVWESILKLHEAIHVIYDTNGSSSEESKQTSLRESLGSLCPQNIFVLSGETESDYNCHFRIASTGTSVEIEGAKLYAAPENLTPVPDTNMQMADVFSLGCVLSEFAVWIATGLSGLNDYRSDRNHEAEVRGTQNGSAFHDGRNLLEAVAFWNSRAIESRADVDRITEAIMHQVVEEMLCEDTDARPTTRQLKAKINKILVRAREQHLADLRRKDSVASNSTGFSSAGRSSKSRLSYWNSVRSDSSGDTHPRNRDSNPIYVERSATARSDTGYWVASPAIDEDKEAFFESSNPLQSTGLASPIESLRLRPIEQMNQGIDGSDAPEPLPFQGTSRVPTVAGINMAALLNGEDKEIFVTRGPLIVPSRPVESSAPELEPITHSVSQMPPSNKPQQIKQTKKPSIDRSGMSTGAPEDHAIRGTTEIRPDHDPRAADPLTNWTSSRSDLNRSQTIESVSSVQTQSNGQQNGRPPSAVSSRSGTKLDKAPNIPTPEVYKPSLDLIDGLLWLNNKKGSASSAALRDESYLSQVGDRDFVFLIDDSSSMRAHREMTSRCVRLMAWLLKKHDKHGMDLLFMSKSGKTHTRPGHSSDLQRPILKTLDECKGVNNLNTRLAQILTDYRSRNATGSGLQTGGRSSFGSLSSTRVVIGTRKLIIYVISDGSWESGSEDQLSNTIDAVAAVLSIQGAPDKAVAIQFIRTTEENKVRFEKLRAGRRDREGKIVVDTIDLESNVFRSLLGPIVDLWDDCEGG